MICLITASKATINLNYILMHTDFWKHANKTRATYSASVWQFLTLQRNTCTQLAVHLTTFSRHTTIFTQGLKKYSPIAGTYHILLLFTNNVFSLLNKGKPSSFLISLSEKSIASNWSKVAPRFSITGILYPTKMEFWNKHTQGINI